MNVVSYMQMFHSAHYAGQPLCAKFRNGEAWKKVFGPVLMYVNSAPLATPETLWNDANEQVIL
jgi:rhamnogalacturonan endolyase